MKKITVVFSSLLIMLSLVACGNTGPQQANTTSPLPNTPEASTTKTESEPLITAEIQSGVSQIPKNEQTGDTNILVVYFSMPETTDPNNMTKAEEDSAVVIDGKVLGNTQYVAQIIQENTNADIFRIEPKTPYPTDHDTLVDLAKKEQKDKARPELVTSVDNMDQYDVIFLGYPNWWADMPMVLYSFLENIDLSDKTIIPFNTHGGSGFSGTMGTIATLQPNATVITDGFTISRSNMDSAYDEVTSWLEKLGY